MVLVDLLREKIDGDAIEGSRRSSLLMNNGPGPLSEGLCPCQIRLILGACARRAVRIAAATLYFSRLSPSDRLT